MTGEGIYQFEAWLPTFAPEAAPVTPGKPP